MYKKIIFFKNFTKSTHASLGTTMHAKLEAERSLAQKFRQESIVFKTRNVFHQPKELTARLKIQQPCWMGEQKKVLS
jgi:hypothetical protein